jgi:hypothetical protein
MILQDQIESQLKRSVKRDRLVFSAEKYKWLTELINSEISDNIMFFFLDVFEQDFDLRDLIYQVAAKLEEEIES